MTFPGPAALGRGLVVTPGVDLAAALAAVEAGWERVRVDEALLAGGAGGATMPDGGAPGSGAAGAGGSAGPSRGGPGDGSGEPGAGSGGPGDGPTAGTPESETPLGQVVERLHRAWASRRPVVVELALGAAALRALRQEVTEERPPWVLGPEFTLLAERLHFLLWRNNYDARSGEAVWWWARKAAALGAVPGGTADVVLPDGTEVWVDGGPRHPLDLPVVHAESVELGRLARQPSGCAGGPGTATGSLAPDQWAAVTHPGGPLRVVAPAGSGKTRTLNGRLLHLVDDRGVESSILTAVAYNARAAAEMRSRLRRPDLQIRTIHSLGWAIVREARPDVSLIGEREVRNRLRRIVPHGPRAGSDTFGPYLEALADVRIALRRPTDLEAERNDVPGFAAAFEAYRAGLAERDECDHDEQIYEAIRLVLADAALRERWQRRCRHLLVDEFQDLTPAYLLLLRLLASPGLNCFGVGDDDQTIYGYAGADPRFLLEYERYFPGAGAVALEVCYRCPAEVVAAAERLLAYNTRRLPKTLRAASAPRPGSLVVRRVAEGAMAAEAAAAVARWRADGVADGDIAVLARVNSMLLAPLAALDGDGVATRCLLGPSLLYRTLVGALLAWVRLALAPGAMDPEDLLEAARRPARKINRLARERLGGRRPLGLERLAALGPRGEERRAEVWSGFVADIAAAARVAAGGDAAVLVDFIMRQVGLGRAAGALDKGRTRPDRAAHAHDLVALRRAAAVYRDPATFEMRLRDVLGRTSGEGEGVLLTTVHRVKGLEWDRVLIFGADEGLLPHHLCDDVEEERRVLHVALTRAARDVVVLADEQQPSRFLDELEGRAPDPATARASRDSRAGRKGRSDRASSKSKAAEAAAGEAPYDEALFEALRQWRLAESKRREVPAFIVFGNRVLKNIARLQPVSEAELAAVSGVGPAKLTEYGAAVLAVVGNHRSSSPG